MPLENHLHSQRMCILMDIINIYQILDVHSASHISEFYTGWLTHWGEEIAKTGADFTAAALEKILQKNGSVVLYVCLTFHLLAAMGMTFLLIFLVWMF